MSALFLSGFSCNETVGTSQTIFLTRNKVLFFFDDCLGIVFQFLLHVPADSTVYRYRVTRNDVYFGESSSEAQILLQRVEFLSIPMPYSGL